MIERYTAADFVKAANIKHASVNYKRVKPFVDAVNATEAKHFTFHSEGFEPLSVEPLYDKDAFGNPIYSIMHYYIQEGDIMYDPMMEFSYDETNKLVLPISYEMSSFGMYQRVFSEDGAKFSKRLMNELDDFLWQWLKNIEAQGFEPSEASKATEEKKEKE